MKKGVLYLALCLLLVTALSLTAAAGGIPAISADCGAFSDSGQTEISVSISGNPGLASWTFEISWDSVIFETPNDAAAVGSAFSRGTFLFKQTEPGKMKVTWFSAKDNASNGPMFSLKLQKTAGAADGTYPVEIKCDATNTVNVSEKTFSIPQASVKLTISSGGSTAPAAATDNQTGKSTDSGNSDGLAGNADVSFADLPAGHWAYSYVQALAKRGIVGGVGGGLFNPNAKVTRAQFVKMLAGVCGADLSSYRSADFTDVPDTAWYMPCVAWARESGIVNGTSSTAFSPDAGVTREQIAAILKRAADKYQITLPQKEEKRDFQDSADISSYAAEAVAAMQQAGIVGGYADGRFLPHGSASRAEAAKMLDGLLKIREGLKNEKES